MLLKRTDWSIFHVISLHWGQNSPQNNSISAESDDFNMNFFSLDSQLRNDQSKRLTFLVIQSL